MVGNCSYVRASTTLYPQHIFKAVTDNLIKLCVKVKGDMKCSAH